MKQFSKIIINGRFLSQKLTGVQRYALEITKALDTLTNQIKLPIELVVPESLNDKDLPTLNNIYIKKYGSSSGIKWEQLELAKYIKKNKALGLHLCNSVPVLAPKGICCVHDITYKVNPQFITTKHLAFAKIWHLFQYKTAIKKSLHVTTVSEYSKQEIIREYHIKPEKITVAYNGYQHFNSSIVGDDSLNKYPKLENKKYYFSLATMAKNKNFPWIVEAARKNPDSIFAVAGNINIQQLGNNLGEKLPDNLITLGYISDNDAKILMKHCKAFLFPSLYEGFGIPPLEAIAMGAPVICSNTTCLPEIFMDCVHYINPYKSIPDLELLLTENLSSPQKVLETYSWDKSANLYLELLKLIIK
ncbi:MAG: glycosyltransferase family 1 protein [Treponema sp.]|nr:glycosyltransferase family 1 protein [Treponema sp.]